MSTLFIVGTLMFEMALIWCMWMLLKQQSETVRLLKTLIEKAKEEEK